MVNNKKRKVKIVKVSKRKSSRNVDRKEKKSSKSKKITTLIIIIFALILINSGIKTIRWVKLVGEMDNLKNSIVIDDFFSVTS